MRRVEVKHLWDSSDSLSKLEPSSLGRGFLFELIFYCVVREVEYFRCMSPAPPFLILDSKIGSIICTSFVHDCIRLFSFVHLLLFFLPWRGERAVDTLSHFSDFGFENGFSRFNFVCTWLYTTFFVCTSQTFLPPTGGGWGHATLFWFWYRKWAQSFVLCLYTIVCIFFRLCTFYFSSFFERGREGDILSSPFLILDSKMGSVVCISLVHHYIRLFSYVHLLLFYLSLGGWGHAMSSFSDFGFENGPNRLYFISTWLYTSFFVCTPLTFLPLSGGAGDMLCPFSNFGFENRLNCLYFVTT